MIISYVLFFPQEKFTVTNVIDMFEILLVLVKTMYVLNYFFLVYVFLYTTFKFKVFFFSCEISFYLIYILRW